MSMTGAQAGMVIATLEAYWPRFPIADSTKTLWARELTRAPFGFDVARLAVSKLATGWPGEAMPSLQAVLAKCREVDATARAAEPKALPEGEPAPPEVVHELIARLFAGRDDDLADAKISVGVASAEERDRMSRAKAARMLEESAPEVAERVTYSGGRVPTPCPIGVRGTLIDGRLCCPHCQEPIQPPARAGKGE